MCLYGISFPSLIVPAADYQMPKEQKNKRFLCAVFGKIIFDPFQALHNKEAAFLTFRKQPQVCTRIKLQKIRRII